MRRYVSSGFLHRRRQMLDNRIQVLAVCLPLLETFLSIALELFVLVLDVRLSFFGLGQFAQEFLFSLLLLFLHLSLELISVLLVHVLPELLLIRLPFLQRAQLLLPGLLELVVIFNFLLFLAPPSLHLVLQRLLVLLLEQTLLFGFFPLDFCLLLLQLFDLVVEPLDIVVFNLAHFEGLLLVEGLPLLYFLINEVLLSFLRDVLHHFYINGYLPCFLRYSSILAYSSFSFCSSRALSSLFFSLISLISFLFCMFLSLRSRSLSSSSRMASSAFNLSRCPSSISSLYLLMYCFLTYLCCLRRFFSNSFSFFFSCSLRLCSSSSPFFTWFYIIDEVRWFPGGIFLRAFSRSP